MKPAYVQLDETCSPFTAKMATKTFCSKFLSAKIKLKVSQLTFNLSKQKLKVSRVKRLSIINSIAKYYQLYG